MTDQYADIAPGFRYTETELSLGPAQQAEKLACCGIDPELYRGFVDPTHFASEAILAAVKSGLSINGNVHWSERFVMRDRIPLDDTLTMKGQITMFEPHPRGVQMRSTFTYSRPDGSVPLTTERTSLRLDPKKAVAGGGKSAPRDLTGFETIAEFSFQPELVARYSAAGNNRIHFDPAVAREFGFRAPIAGGLMGVRHIMAALCGGDGPPSNFDLFVRFRRPMFWDEDMRVMATRRNDGSFEQIHLVNAGGRITVEGSFTSLD